MRKLIGLLIFGYSLVAWGDGCTIHTYSINGKMTICTTCCYMNQCNTTCR